MTYVDIEFQNDTRKILDVFGNDTIILSVNPHSMDFCQVSRMLYNILISITL